MSDSDEYGPPLPPALKSKKSEDSSEDDVYGPAVPPKSSSSQQARATIRPSLPKSKDSSDSDSDSSSGESDINPSKKQKTIGPTLPQHLSNSANKSDTSDEDNEYIGPVLPSHLKHLETAPVENEVQGSRSDSDNDTIGPSIGLKASGNEQTSAAEFEMRAQKMHAKLTGKDKDQEAEAPAARETWMTELPSAMNKQFGLENRTFRKKDAPELDAGWTDTPQEKERKKKEESGTKRKRKPDGFVPTEKDIKMAKEIDKYNKSHRPESLLAMHEKKLKKKKKKEKKKKKKKDKKQEERQPFDRDRDLQVNRLDDAQRKAMIKRSKELNTRFKTGGTGTSFL